jgi:hypothetical protein
VCVNNVINSRATAPLQIEFEATPFGVQFFFFGKMGYTLTTRSHFTLLLVAFACGPRGDTDWALGRGIYICMYVDRLWPALM